MRVAGLRIRVLADPAARAMVPGGLRRDAVIVEVLTDGEAVGVASAWCPQASARALAEQIALLEGRLIEQDPLLVERHWHAAGAATRVITSMMAVGVVDVALWDLVARAARLPLYRVLGACRDEVAAYAGSHVYETPEASVEECRRLRGDGFRAFKLHLEGDVRRDVARCTAVRGALGPDVVLMADAGGRYDRSGARYAGRALEELDFHWFEEPLPDGDLDGYVELTRALRIPVAAMDSVRLSLPALARCVARRAFDVARTDVGRHGITFSRKLAAIAEGFHLAWEPHSYGPALAQAANLHLAASVQGCRFVELPSPLGIMDLETTAGLRLTDDGMVALPQAPGLGLELDWERITALTTAIVDTAGAAVTT